MSILLIRHGETASNAQRIVQTPDTPLSERGLEQAERLAERLHDVGIVRILASDLARAEMTARALARASGAPLELEADLHERNFGDLRGRAYAEAGVGENIFAPGFAPPAGETWAQFDARVDRAWQRIGRESAALDGPLAVVTHGLVCHSIVSRHADLPADLAEQPRSGRLLRFGNTALTVIEAHPPWRVQRFACTRHLDPHSADDPTAIAGI